jgi:hypothetical protein
MFHHTAKLYKNLVPIWYVHTFMFYYGSYTAISVETLIVYKVGAKFAIESRQSCETVRHDVM